ncbi:MAG: hypothetical protein IKK00_01800 [Oscillospiraceae bacterium]|nr:hypothetical protein [Oscillospiraceae bacterium]
MIRLRDLRLAPGEDETKLYSLAARELGIKSETIEEIKILRKSLDARRKTDIHWIYTVAVSVENEDKVLLRAKNKNADAYLPPVYTIPRCRAESRPVVVGFGPAGMFASLVLAKAGLRPIVLERGRDVDTRTADVRRFWAGGALDERSNVQFGEGGAGTFSDGKLNTGTHDVRIAWVLKQFHAFGAPEAVTYDAKPHVGTDVLADVVKNLRREVLALGGELRFCHQLTGLQSENGRLTGAVVSAPEGEYLLPCSELLLAPGHSARDTFEMLLQSGVPMEQKPFSMGVRIEHLQKSIGEAQYGESYVNLPPADYKLNCRLPDGESAYTFCMCPGGTVVAAASEAGGLVTNGMSESRRDGENANAAVLVTLYPEDFPGKGTLAGMYWQREIEQRCFACGGGNYLAPAQTVGDFLAGRSSTGPGSVLPSYRPGVIWCDLHEVLPEKLTGVLERALPELGRKLRGFDAPDAVLTAPETRSSSPVRICRDETRQSALRGLYPCGEGAGYAGGITSAAVDGIRCAEAILEKYIVAE